jgi:hypothetical protein
MCYFQIASTPAHYYSAWNPGELIHDLANSMSRIGLRQLAGVRGPRDEAESIATYGNVRQLCHDTRERSAFFFLDNVYRLKSNYFRPAEEIT